MKCAEITYADRPFSEFQTQLFQYVMMSVIIHMTFQTPCVQPEPEITKF